MRFANAVRSDWEWFWLASTAPVVLIYSGNEQDNEEIRCRLARQYPHLPLVTANSEAEVARHLPEAEVLLAWDFPVKLLPLGRKLRWFQMMGAGVDALTNGVRPPAHVTVTNIKGVFGTAMAEYALTYMLAHSQNLRGVLRRQALREWAPFAPQLLAGKTVGIAGLGSIGQEVARRCAALGMRVIGLKRKPGPVEHVERVYLTGQMEEFLPQCDFLVLVLPHTDETAGLLTRERLRLLKPSCFLINMGRGTVMREGDLVEALRDGWLAGAALDVFPAEPLPPESPLWSLPNVYITPHIAGINRAEELVPVILENLGRYLQGEPLLNQVDLNQGY